MQRSPDTNLPHPAGCCHLQDKPNPKNPLPTQRGCSRLHRALHGAPGGIHWDRQGEAGSSFMPSFTLQRQTLPSSAACGRGGSASGKGLKNCLCLQVQLSSIMSPGEGKKYHNEVHQNIHFQGCPSGKKGKYWLEPAADFLGEQFFDRKCQLDHIKISC